MFTSKKIVTLYIISFMDLFAVGLTYPLLYPYLRSLGASYIIVGLFGSAYSGLQVLSGPIIGGWSDLRGRKPVLIMTLLLSCFGYLFLGITSSIYFLFIIRLLLGIVKHTQTLCKAIVADTVPRKYHAEVYGRSAALGSLGFVVGPIIGGHLSEFSSGFFYVCSLTATLFVINIGLTSSYIPQETLKSCVSINALTALKNVGSELATATAELTHINWRIYWDAFAFRFLFGLSISIFFSCSSMLIQEKYNLSQKHVGYTISFLSIISALSSYLLGTVTNMFYKTDVNCTKRLLHMFAIMSVSFLGLCVAPSLNIFLVLLVPFSVSSGILRIVSMELMLDRSGNNERGSLAGASNSLMSIARFFAPISSGIVGDLFGQNAIMFSAFVPSMCGAILCIYCRYKKQIDIKMTDL